MQQLREYLKEKSNMFLSEHIKYNVLTITSENPYTEDRFERKSQAKISPSDQNSEKYKEALIKFKGKYHDELRKSSSVPIQNEVLTFTSEHPPSEYHSENKFQSQYFSI